MYLPRFLSVSSAVSRQCLNPIKTNLMEQVGFCQLGEVQVVTSIKGRKCKKQTVMFNFCCLFFLFFIYSYHLHIRAMGKSAF